MLEQLSIQPINRRNKFLLLVHMATGWDVDFSCLSSLSSLSSLTDADAPVTLAAAGLPALSLAVAWSLSVKLIESQCSPLEYVLEKC